MPPLPRALPQAALDAAQAEEASARPLTPVQAAFARVVAIVMAIRAYVMRAVTRAVAAVMQRFGGGGADGFFA